MARISYPSLAHLLLSATGAFAGLTVDVDDAASIKTAAAIVAEDLMSYYKGDIPGILPGPPPEGDYYWWSGGALWTVLLDYRSRTNDTQYDDKISEALLWQRGPNNDYLSPNWTASTGNDDQAVWAMAALLAAETGFTKPTEDDLTSWINLTQNVYNEQASPDRRVSNGSCEGGLRWQIFPTNNGYNYVATSASAAYANIGARLSFWNGGNETQANSVKDTFDWLQAAGLIDDKFNVFDGAVVPDCDQISKLQFSYVSALLLESAAVMYNSTNGDEKWKTLVDGLTKRTIDVFFPNGVATEVSCELRTTCNTDMTFFKSFLHRSLAATMRAAPYTESQIFPVLKSSAAAAVTSCVGGKNGRMCGLNWSGNSDDEIGAGSQMSVLSALLSLLPVEKLAEPSTSNSGSGKGGSDTSGTATPTPTPPDNLGTHAGISFIVLLGALSSLGSENSCLIGLPSMLCEFFLEDMMLAGLHTTVLNHDTGAGDFLAQDRIFHEQIELLRERYTSLFCGRKAGTSDLRGERFGKSRTFALFYLRTECKNIGSIFLLGEMMDHKRRQHRLSRCRVSIQPESP
ncbi:hypothetical protein RRF57_003093 [Xylaria bambusicola]|uniref:mannan endo-1,6-alpha-mannosidase n=1 Tax=Xylaria bambusicola TaxID=326684 RepID=A0AAN7UFK5_9PEZI